MRKIALFIGLFFYLLTASGATLHLHFCQGEAQSVSLSQDQTVHCPLCAKSEKEQQNHCHQEGSCKDVTIAAQKVDDFNRLSQTLNFNHFSPAIITLHWIYDYYQFPADEDSSSKLITNQNTFLRRYSPAVFILNQSFRI
ncbi:hypothetical protein BWD42_18335 [Sphingobacterium sp. CZ-UAM]|jgi:hypothetical protein|uniref:HYC_CC_PP family protein n=1 Tax=Sphingobacterium sp. CZ-UAM TaxID=1933868 RepID=UPI000984D188|nr:hypothetical protein [Sphingobacterium sp. CZ-UAM]OOG16780.1 hypothetical protein BWD42_18335 [Sphingobacterium sp. CZ-UAM]